jgi:hypothetical protein
MSVFRYLLMPALDDVGVPANDLRRGHEFERDVLDHADADPPPRQRL